MSYYSGPTYGGIEPITPQLYDIATIQYLYGANTSTRSGNDTYTFSTSLQVKTIWDGGGNDTFDASNQPGAVTINLRPAASARSPAPTTSRSPSARRSRSRSAATYNDTLRASDAGSTLSAAAATTR